MDSDIRLFIGEIIENTGVDLCVFDEKGEYVFGNAVSGENVPTDFTGVFSDVGLNKTFFKLKYKNKHYTGRIKGAGKIERNYAFLISELSEKTSTKTSNFSREEFYKAVMLGETSSYQIEKNMRKFAVTDRAACVMIVSAPQGKTDDVIEVLNAYGAGSDDCALLLDETHCALVKFSDEAAGEYRSFTEYAEFLQRTIYEETGVETVFAIGGTVDTVADLSVSFSQASSAQRMSNSVKTGGSVYSFKDFVLVKMLEDMPKHKLNEYLALLTESSAREIFADSEMTGTAEEFLENSLNISETSRKLYLHRNTLTYRLDKIERATGLNIRKFSDAVIFRLITILSKLAR